MLENCSSGTLLKTGVVKSIVFDIGNVLVNFSMEALAGFLLEHGARFTSEAEFREAIPIWEYERGEISTEQFFSGVQSVCSQEIDLARARKLWVEIFTPNNELMSVARDLSTTCQVGILSNTSELHWDYLLDNYRFDQFASVLMPSFQLGCMKPEPEIYQRAEEILGARGEEILFFDDRPENVEGARKRGWQAVHFRENSDVFDALRMLESAAVACL